MLYTWGTVAEQLVALTSLSALCFGRPRPALWHGQSIFRFRPADYLPLCNANDWIQDATSSGHQTNWIWSGSGEHLRDLSGGKTSVNSAVGGVPIHSGGCHNSHRERRIGDCCLRKVASHRPLQSQLCHWSMLQHGSRISLTTIKGGFRLQQFADVSPTSSPTNHFSRQ